MVSNLPTGGTGISADKSTGSPSAGYTALGTLTLTSGTSADISAASGTITLTAPTGWQFQSGTGTVTGAGNVTVGSYTVGSTTITIPYTNTGASLSNAITLTGLLVQPTNGKANSGNIVATSSPTITGLNSSNVAVLSEVAGTFVKLQTLLPGETNAPGTATGKTGTVTAQSAGAAVSITVNAVDYNWNKVTTAPTDLIVITSTDGNATIPASANLASGTKTFSVTLRTITSSTITATDNTDGTKTANTSSSVTVSLGALAQYVIVLPGETFAGGTAAGKTGTASTPTAGTSFSINVYAVDAGNNLVSSVTNTVSIGSSDANATLPSSAALSAGTQSFNFTFKTAASKNITATDGTKTGTSSSVTVSAAAFAQLQLLLPGETAAAGTATGKTGTPSAQSAGTALTVTVNAVDAYWNKVTTAPTDNIAITSSDGNAALPATAALSSGTKTFSITLRTVTNSTITATDATDGTKTASTSPAVTVNLGAYSSLLIVLPGETFAGGTATGKTGTATAPTAGSSFSFTAYAVDAANNLITSINNSVAITSTDANALLPASASLSSGVQSFNFTFKTSGSFKITATDATASKTGSTASLTVGTGAFTKLLVLLPGETYAPGTATGKSGTPTAQGAGVAFSVTVDAVDANWNKVTTVSDMVNITLSDGNGTAPANAVLASGTKTNFSVTLRTPGTATITASDVTDNTKTQYTSSSVTVNIGTLAALLTVLPGETFANGTATGKTGTPTSPVAGTAFSFSVYAVDAGNNLLTSVTDDIGITSTDVNAVLPANASLVAGTQSFSFTFKTAGSLKITATDAAASKSITTASLTVIPGTFAKLQLLLPGETAAAGTASGKTGTPTNRASGTAFNVIVNAVDANWNKITSITTANPALITDVINIISNDAAVNLPVSTGTMSAGTKTISVTLKTPTTTGTLQAVDNSNSGITVNTSPAFTVTIGTFSKLQILLPGEIAAPNTSTGKTGTPTAQVAGTPFTVTVNAVDANWNIVTSATDVVGITSTDANATNPTNAALVAGTQSFSFTFKTAGTRRITASDITNTSRTANTSPNTTVSAGAFVKLLALAPGESSAPGTATGKTGTPATQSAGTAFNITVLAVDANWNKVTTVTDVINITCTDGAATVPANAALVSGTKTYAVTLKTIGTATVTAKDNTDNTKTQYTTSTITNAAGAFKQLLVLMPGESSAPGTTTGKSGTATTQTAGTSFNVTVYAVDAAWNILTTPTDQVSITSSDANAVLPASANLVAGTKTFTVTCKTAGSKTVTATDATSGSITPNTGTSTTISPAAFSQFQIIYPSETAKPGTALGKSGVPNPSRGANFTITVNAVDAYFNVVTTYPTTLNYVTLALSDHSSTAYIVTTTAGVFSGTITLTNGTKSGINVKVIDTSPSPLPKITISDGGGVVSTAIDVPLNVPATAATDYFQLQDSGLWSDASIWLASTDGLTNWHATTLTPGTSSSGVELTNGNVVTINASTTVSKLTVDNGAQLIVTSPLTINTGLADIHGTVTASSTISTTNGGTIKFESDGKYQHNYTGTAAGTIPTATWDASSTCEIIGYTNANTAMGGGNQSFGNFIWNCPNQNITGGVALLGTGTNTASMNSLTITSTGSTGSTFQLVSGTNATANVTVKSFTQTGGNFLLSNTASATGNLNITGDFNVSGGTMKTTGLNLISFSGTTKQNFIKTGGTFTTAVNFGVNSNAILDFGSTNVLDGSTGTFTLNSGSTLITANDDGISATGGSTGSVQIGGTRNFGTAANFIYNGTNAQSAGTGLPTTINNITINNSQGVTLPAATSTYTVNGAVTLTSGNLDMNTNNLVQGTSFTATGTGFIRTQSISSTPISSGKTWTVGVEYYGSAAQSVVAGTYSNLSFSSSGTKTATGTITVTGNWSSSDGKVDFLTNSATAQFTGSGSQTLNDDGSDSGKGVVFGNVTFGNSGTKTLTTGTYSLATTGLLTMSGSAVLAANGKLTVLSDASGTGNIGPLTSGAITGNVNVQCFVTGGGDITNRGYRLLSSPISDASAANTYFNLTFLQGTDSWLTGSGGTGSGFDASGNPTLYLYREDKVPNSSSFTSGNYRAITALNGSPAYNVSTIDGAVNLGVGNGLMYFFRGNKSTVSTNLPYDVTFSSTGPLNQGQITVQPWFTGANTLSYNSATVGDPRAGITGFNLVGNPYACSIDWNTAFDYVNNQANTNQNSGIYAPNTDQTIYIYNPQTKNFATYLNTYPVGGSNTNGGTNIIPSGQGFFVRATNSSAKLVFNESAKVNSHPASGSIMLNSSSAVVSRQMHLQLAKDSINKDDNAFVFNDAASTDYTVNEDALYLSGSGAVSLSNLSADNKKLAINQLPLPKHRQAIPLVATVSAQGTYNFSLSQISNIPKVYDIWLVDNYQRDSLDLRANARYDFNVTADAASHDGNRFQLVIKPNPALSVHLLNFAAAKSSTSAVNINWTVENEGNYTSYILQRSTDGGHTFKVLDSLTSANLGVYNDLDPYPVVGDNKYRLKQVDVLGNVSYSNVITVMYALPGNNSIVNSRISLYPNPTANTLNISVKASNNASVTGNYKITVTSAAGIVVKSAISTQPNWHGDVSGLSPGTYFIEVINLKDNSLTGRSSFVKL